MLSRAIRDRSSVAVPLPIKEWALIGAVALQGLHFVEHIAQVPQKFFLDLPNAHGILGAAFDTEWVHFGYNLALLTVLWGLLFAYRLHYRSTWTDQRAPWGRLALLFLAAFQSYHMVEHSVKVAQHIITGCVSCPGLLGTTFNLVWLHFFINLVIVVLLAIAVTGFVLAVGPSRTDQHDPVLSTGGN